jgi:hypothetical protein
MPLVTTGCLLYGDYPELARQCLTPLAGLFHQGRIGLRVGANEPSNRVIAECQRLDIDLKVESPQIYKYPMMRKLLSAPYPEDPWVMWFDDDSWVTAPDPSAWMTDLEARLERASSRTAMVGAIYHIGRQGLTEQGREWFTSKYPNTPYPPPTGPVRFCTGGWWALRTSVMRQMNWPHPALIHNGGDVALAIVLSMHGYTIESYHQGVAINAGLGCVKHSAAKRRGASHSYPYEFR